jgi:hypothetical protein
VIREQVWKQGQDSQPEHDGRCDADGGEEQLTASVVAGGDATPVLEAREQVLDPVTLLVEFPVVAGGGLAPAPGRDAGGNSRVLKGLAEPVGIVALVGQERPCGQESIQQGRRTSRVPHLAGRQEEGQRPTQPAAAHVQLRPSRDIAS